MLFSEYVLVLTGVFVNFGLMIGGGSSLGGRRVRAKTVVTFLGAISGGMGVVHITGGKFL